MSWFNTEGNRPHHVIYTQTKYIRNLSSLTFTSPDAKLLDTEMQKIDKIMSENGFKRENLPDGNCSQAISLAEKGFVGSDFCKNESGRALYLNEPCSLAISIGDEELITIRSILPGLSVLESRNIAAGAEELLDGEFEFAYSDEYGYLSSSPETAGSGAELSALLFLPCLSESNAETIKNSCSAMGARFGRAFTYKGNTGGLYRISYVPLRFEDEAKEVARFSSLIDKIIEFEKDIERVILSEKSKVIEDRAMRAWGTLLYATIVSEEEMLSLLSDIRIALILGLPCNGLNIDLVKLGELIAECLNASVIASSAIPCSSIDECNALRAERIKELISNK